MTFKDFLMEASGGGKTYEKIRMLAKLHKYSGKK